METPYSKEIQAAVIEARLTGMLVKDICRKFHVCDQTIRDWMKADANVVGRTSLKKTPIKLSPHVQSSRENGRFSDEDRRELVKLYQAGHSIADLCRSRNHLLRKRKRGHSISIHRGRSGVSACLRSGYSVSAAEADFHGRKR